MSELVNRGCSDILLLRMILYDHDMMAFGFNLNFQVYTQ